MFFHEANSRQNLSGWRKGEIRPKSLCLTPVNVGNISQKSHQRRHYQPKIPPRPENSKFGTRILALFRPKNRSRVSRIIFPVSSRGVAILAPLGGPIPGHVSAFAKLAIKRDPDLGIDFRLLRRLTPAHVYNAGQKSPPAPKTRNLGKIRVLYIAHGFWPFLPKFWDPELRHNFPHFLVP